MKGWTDSSQRWDPIRYWPVEPKTESFALYVCGACGLQAKVPPTLTFTRVPHFCRAGDSARMVA
jgi:hypothetical protein